MFDPLDARITVRLPGALARSLAHMARSVDVTEGEIVRRALTALLGTLPEGARSAEGRDELLDSVRTIVSEVLENARTWSQVQKGLQSMDLRYLPKGGGLSVGAISNNQEICKASEVGPAYQALVRRFGHFPGHPHIHIAKKIADEDPSLIDEDDRPVRSLV